MLSTKTSSNNTSPNINDDTMLVQIKSKRNNKKKHSSNISSHHNKYLVENKENTPHKERKDAYGITIKKGSKKHKVSFIDVVSLFHKSSTENQNIEEVALAEIIDVCSYKAYNEQMSYKEDDQYGDKTDVHCCDGKCLVT